MRTCPPSATPTLDPAAPPPADPLAGLPPDLRERVERDLGDYPGQSVKKILARIRRFDAAAASPGVRRLYRLVAAAAALAKRARRFYYAHADCGCDFCRYVDRDTLAGRELFHAVIALSANLDAFNLAESELPALPGERDRHRKVAAEAAAREGSSADAPVVVAAAE